MKEKKIDIEKIKIKEDHLNHFQFDEFKGRYLLTNDFGNYILLSPENFGKLLEDKIERESGLYKELWDKGFLRRDLSDYEILNEQYRRQKASLFSGPSLHIIVVTLRCNENCIYCQASAKKMDDSSLDMSEETARKTVDTIFETPSDIVVIEFQGGEPLANWDIVKFIVSYAQEKGKETGKRVDFSLVTNMTLLDKEKLDFLTSNLVGICSSLDGPKELHNRNRPYPGGDSYGEVIKWIKRYREKKEELEKKGKELPRINALVTVSRLSLDYPEKIVDEYLKLNISGVHLRPVSYLGYSAGQFREKMGYSIDEFLEFWKKGVDYIVDLNNKGNQFIERGVVVMLRKILARQDPGYTDLNSPCGAVIGQMLYNYDGNVYTCDEGRMIGDDTFKIGSVGEDDYEDMIGSETTQAVITASLLDNQPCQECVYKPYCGVCPVKNYAHYGTLSPQIKNTEWCRLHKGQFDYIFSKMEDKKYKKVFEDWISPYREKAKQG